MRASLPTSTDPLIKVGIPIYCAILKCTIKVHRSKCNKIWSKIVFFRLFSTELEASSGWLHGGWEKLDNFLKQFLRIVQMRMLSKQLRGEGTESSGFLRVCVVNDGGEVSLKEFQGSRDDITVCTAEDGLKNALPNQVLTASQYFSRGR